MSTTILPLTIGGVTRDLKFNMGVARHLATTGDGTLSLVQLKHAIESEDLPTLYGYAWRIAYAALVNNKITITHDEVHDWLAEGGTIGQMIVIITNYIQVITAGSQASKEGSDDTRGQATHVA